MIAKNLYSILCHDFLEDIFSAKYKLVPNLNEIYELELAYYEKQVLTEAELIQNGAYFSRVGDTFTRHFLMCTGKSLKLPEHSSSRLRSFCRFMTQTKLDALTMNLTRENRDRQIISDSLNHQPKYGMKDERNRDRIY